MRASNRRVLNAAARIDSQETRKVQLHCQPVSNAIPLGAMALDLDIFIGILYIDINHRLPFPKV
jgi:hypothetical protein